MSPCFLAFGQVDTGVVKFRGAENSSVGKGRWIFVVLPAINVRSCINTLVGKGSMGNGYFQLFFCSFR